MMHVTFAEIRDVLTSAGATMPAAEAHGCLCGVLCVNARYAFEHWLEEMIPAATELVDGDRQALRLLFADTIEVLRGQDMEFEPLLPDDDIDLEPRVVALSQWCQGFLYGFGTARPVESSDITPAINEILRDFTHIGRAAVEVGAGNQDEEHAYVEVVEFVRVSAQLIHDEMLSRRR